MARKTIKITINPDADTLQSIGSAIAARHAELKDKSPLVLDTLPGFLAQTAKVAALQAEIRKIEAEVQTKYGERNQVLGIAAGQSSQTAGTVYFEIMRIRDLLLSVHRGNEEALESWGFPVSVGAAKSGAARKAKTSASS